jgi:hypothetical protein
LQTVHFKGGAWHYPCGHCVSGQKYSLSPSELCQRAYKTTAVGEFICDTFQPITKGLGVYFDSLENNLGGDT